MFYDTSTNRFKWFTTKPQTGLSGLLTYPYTGLDGLLTDLHTGLNCLPTILSTGSIGLLQSHKPVYLVYYKSTNRFIWFTTNPQTV